MEPDFDGHQGSDDSPPAVAGKAWSSLDYSENNGDKKWLWIVVEELN